MNNSPEIKEYPTQAYIIVQEIFGKLQDSSTRSIGVNSLEIEVSAVKMHDSLAALGFKYSHEDGMADLGYYVMLSNEVMRRWVTDFGASILIEKTKTGFDIQLRGVQDLTQIESIRDKTFKTHPQEVDEVMKKMIERRNILAFAVSENDIRMNILLLGINVNHQDATTFFSQLRDELDPSKQHRFIQDFLKIVRYQVNMSLSLQSNNPQKSGSELNDLPLNQIELRIPGGEHKPEEPCEQCPDVVSEHEELAVVG